MPRQKAIIRLRFGSVKSLRAGQQPRVQGFSLEGGRPLRRSRGKLWFPPESSSLLVEHRSSTRTRRLVYVLFSANAEQQISLETYSFVLLKIVLMVKIFLKISV